MSGPEGQINLFNFPGWGFPKRGSTSVKNPPGIVRLVDSSLGRRMCGFRAMSLTVARHELQALLARKPDAAKLGVVQFAKLVMEFVMHGRENNLFGYVTVESVTRSSFAQMVLCIASNLIGVAKHGVEWYVHEGLTGDVLTALTAVIYTLYEPGDEA